MLKNCLLLMLFLISYGIAFSQNIDAYCFYDMKPDLKNGKIIGTDSAATYLYYKEDMVLLQLPYLFVPDMMAQDITKQRYLYFVIHRDSTYGYLFEENTAGGGDTMLRREMVSTVNKYSMLFKVFFDKHVNKLDLELSSAAYSDDSATLVLKYNFRKDGDTSIIATGMITFSEQVGNIPYSMSYKADSLSKRFPPARGRKTTEIKMNFLPWIDPQTRMKQEALTLRYWLTPWKKFNYEEVDRYFKRYQERVNEGY